MSELPPTDGRPNTRRTVTRFGWDAWMSGFFLSLLVGGFLNIVFSMTGASTNETIAAFLIGAIPGAIFILLWRVLRGRNPELASGMLVGGCVIALIGGACGASMVGMGMH